MKYSTKSQFLLQKYNNIEFECNVQWSYGDKLQCSRVFNTDTYIEHHISVAFGAFLDTLIALRLCDFICVSAGTWKMEKFNIVPRSGQVNNLSLSTSLAEVRCVLLAESFNVISLKLWVIPSKFYVKWNLQFATFVFVLHLSVLILLFTKYSSHSMDEFLVIIIWDSFGCICHIMWDSFAKLTIFLFS